jgi:HK97 family phage major capsid protein
VSTYQSAIRAALEGRRQVIIGRDRHGRPIHAIAGGAPTATDDKPTTDSDRGQDRPTAPTLSLEDVRGKTPEELHELIRLADAHIKAIHQDDRGAIRELDDAEEAALAQLLAVRDKAEGMLTEHRRIADVLNRRPETVQRAMRNLDPNADDPLSAVRRMSFKEARDHALRRLDTDREAAQLTDDQRTLVERQVRRNTEIARRILVTENEAYREAFLKLVTNPNGALTLTEDERQAIAAWEEFRAMSETTTTAGGFGIPVFIDPSIILTAQETDNPFLQLAREVSTGQSNFWKGVSSAGVTWSFDTEGAEVSDDSPTLAQPSVQVHMARGFIPFSIEVGQDYPSFAEEMRTLLAAGYDELLVDKLTRGSGTGEPQGILTALSANTNVRVALTTAGALGTPDPYKVWNALPQKYRRRASWLMSVNVNSGIRQLGTSTQFHAFSVGIREEWLDELMNKGVYESPYMPDLVTSTSSTIGLAVVGDFQNYVIARRGGMSIELVQHLVGTNHRPTGQRGWFAYARVGGGSANDLAFRLLVNS